MSPVSIKFIRLENVIDVLYIQLVHNICLKETFSLKLIHTDMECRFDQFELVELDGMGNRLSD